MQCGATALIVNVAVDLVYKQCKKKLALPLAILVGTFAANFFFGVNLMLLVVIDGILGLLLLCGPEYDGGNGRSPADGFGDALRRWDDALDGFVLGIREGRAFLRGRR